ncbi:MAG: spermidine/putrescine ABC transporter substrate-binding protein [Phascolarctobacterium sp.]|nr:spermidine/putrescine ABC transporter substrate-binding protein [Phascolarctobacterium sp.]
MKKIIFLMLTVFTLLLMGCGGSKEEKPQAEEPNTSGKQVLNIACWPDIIDPELVSAFEKKYNCRVNYDVISNNEETLAKMQAGGAQYDMIQASDYMVEIMIKLKLIDKIDKSKMKHVHNMVPFLRKPAYDPNGEYSVPYDWGFTGIVYNKKYVKKVPTSWADLWDPDYRNRVILLNDSREVIGMALKKNGHSNNTTNKAEIDNAIADLKGLMPNVMAFDTDTIKQKVIAEEAWIGMMWSGDASFVRNENPDIGYVVPKEGGVIWADNMLIPTTSRNPKLAIAFIDFLFEPKNAAKNFEYIGYDQTNLDAMPFHTEEFRNDPVLKEARDNANKGEWLKDIDEAIVMYDRAWTELKSGM